MRWTGNGLHGGIIAGALILVPNDKADRRAQRCTLFQAGENFNTVSLVACSRKRTLAGGPAVKLRLYIVFAQGHAGQAAVNTAAESRAVGFTEGRQFKQGAECT